MPDPWTPSRELLAWCAGFFDGEGYIGYDATEGKVMLALNQVHPEVLEQFRSAFGGRLSLYGPLANGGGNHRPRYHLKGRSLEVVQWVVVAMWSWLGPIKRRQAKFALAAYHSDDRKRQRRRVGG